MNELLLELLKAGFYGTLGMLMMHREHERRMKEEHPFSYKCPFKGCVFEVGSNNARITDSIIQNHMGAYEDHRPVS